MQCKLFTWVGVEGFNLGIVSEQRYGGKHKGLLVRLVAERFVSLQTQILYFSAAVGAPTFILPDVFQNLYENEENGAQRGTSKICP